VIPYKEFNCPHCGAPGHVHFGQAEYSCICRLGVFVAPAKASVDTSLLERCIDPIQDRIDDYKNDRASYEGYPERQKRYDLKIAEDEELLAAVRAASQSTGSQT
jgi:hypothetical protein